jgi:hypothetical protein
MNSKDERTVIGGVDRNDGTFAAPAQETKCARIGMDQHTGRSKDDPLYALRKPALAPDL